MTFNHNAPLLQTKVLDNIRYDFEYYMHLCTLKECQNICNIYSSPPKKNNRYIKNNGPLVIENLIVLNKSDERSYEIFS